MRTVQGKLVILFLALALLATQIGGAQLLHSLEAYHRDLHEERLRAAAATVASMLAPAQEDGLIDVSQAGELLRAALPGEGSGVVLSPAGDVLAVRSGDEGLTDGGDELPGDLAREALQWAMVSSRSGPAGRPGYVEAAAPVLQPDGRVIGAVYLRASLGEVDALLDEVRRSRLQTTITVVAIMALLIYLLGRSITRPIRELIRRAEEMAAGDFDQRIAVTADDEFGQLGRVFNTLAARLKTTVQEISREKRKTEAVVTHMADGLLALDGEGRILLANPAAGRLLGVEPHRVTGQTPEAAFPGLPLGRAVRRTLERGEAHTEQLELPAGGIVRGHFAPLADESGRRGGIVIVLQDITEEQRLERMRREFVDNVSHELRTPLTIIKSYVETLEEQAVENPVILRRFLRIVRSQTDRIVKLVADLLHIARMDSRQVELRPTTMGAAAAVARVAQTVRHPLRERNHTLRLRIRRPLPLIRADRDAFERIVLNLLANAIEHNPRGSLIEVRVQPEHARQYPGGAVRVTVADNGSGIPAPDRERVFERFYRVDKARSRRSGGTGLGLTIVKELVERLGGDVLLESQEGQGTRVSVRLPLGGPDRDYVEAG